MALPKERIQFPMVGGVDQSIDQFVIPSPKMVACDNAYSEKVGSIRKRCGFANMTTTTLDSDTTTSPRGLANLKDRLVQIGATGKAYEYAATADRWIKKGTCYGLNLETTGIVGTEEASGIMNADSASANGYTVFGYLFVLNATISTRITVQDEAGTIYATQQILHTNTPSAVSGGIRVVAHGDLIYVIWLTDLLVLKCFIIDTSSTANLVSSLAGSNVNIATSVASFDAVDNTDEGVFLARVNGSKVFTYGFLNAAGSHVTTDTYTAAIQPLRMSVAVAPNKTTHGVAYSGSSASTDLYAILREFDGVSVWTNTQSSGVIDSALTSAILFNTCIFDSNTVLRIFYSGDDHASSLTSTEYAGRTHQATYNTSGTATPQVKTLRKGLLASRVFTVGGEQFFWVYVGRLLSVVQPTYFLTRASDNKPVAWTAQSGASFEYFITGALAGVTVSDDGLSATCPLAYLSRVVAAGTFVGPGTEIALKAVTVSWPSDTAGPNRETLANLQANDSLYVTDGFLREYDGEAFVESNFLRFTEAELIDATLDASSGAFTGGDYFYYIIPESVNINGTISQGSTTGAVQVTQVLGSEKKVNITIPTIIQTLKHMYFGVYRTDVDPTSDSPAIRIGSVFNDTTVDEVTFQDDGSVIIGEELYITKDELDHIAPPSGNIITSGNGRVFIAGFDTSPNLVWYSKQRVDGRGLAFSDSLTLLLPDDGGPIVALDFVSDSLVVFKQNRIYRISGPGLDNTGRGNGFSDPILISTDTGCITQRSVLRVPGGIVFQSQGGLYMLDAGFGLTFIGAPVEDTVGDNTVISAIHDPKRQHIRFAMDNDAGAVLFDYANKLWSTYAYFNQAITGPMALYNGEVASVLSTEMVSLEDPTLFTDAGEVYAMVVTLSWAKLPQALLGAVRFYRVGFLGTAMDSTFLRITSRVNYDKSTTPDIFTHSVAGNVNVPHRFFHRFSKQPAHSLQISLSDDGQETESWVMHEVILEVAARKPRLGRPVASGS